MIHSEGTWQTPDGYLLYHQEWKPEKAARAVIILVHGLGEHCSRYSHVANYFTEHGFALYAFDLRGHGKSSGIRGHAAFEDLCKDIHHFIGAALTSYPDLPVFIYGHSMGGSLALYYGFCQNPQLQIERITGFIITSPGLMTFEPVSSRKQLLARIMARLYPSFTMDNGLDRTGLSRTHEVIDQYNADPLVHGKVSARLGLDIIEKGQWILEQTNFTLPLLLLSGTADRIVHPDGPRILASKLRSNVKFCEFDGWYHELHNEAEKEEVLGTIHNWIEQQVHQNEQVTVE